MRCCETGKLQFGFLFPLVPRSDDLPKRDSYVCCVSSRHDMPTVYEIIAGHRPVFVRRNLDLC
jgi:hypothetical protein